MTTMRENMVRQITLLDEEQRRVKDFVNQHGFDCTTAPFVLAVEYRNKLKQHIMTLKENLDDY